MDQDDRQDSGASYREFELIDRITALFPGPPDAQHLGIGDDAAVFPSPEHGRSLLAATDMMVEGTHFTRQTLDPEHLGHKALAVNLSDIAAMGGQTRYALMAIGLPAGMDRMYVDRLFAGCRDLAGEHRVLLMGGDVAQSDLMTITVTVIGEAAPDQIRRRSDAAEGDVVCLTGPVGDSGGGLRLLLEGGDTGAADARPLLQAHRCPTPHTHEGPWLGRTRGVHALIDVSDGLASDLGHVCRASRLGATVRLEDVPVSGPLQRQAGAYGWDLFHLACCAGEDYSLLVTVDADRFEAVSREFELTFDRKLYRIGRMEDRTPRQVRFTHRGSPYELSQQGYEHF